VSQGARIQDTGWMYLVLPLLVGNLVCLFCACAVNNLSKKRQYPVVAWT
jgi:CBS-domain-containing membrane protein